MVGATDTTIGPEVAFIGMVTVIDVLLQELIVIGELFSSTALLP
jgi:hypothetical protein